MRLKSDFWVAALLRRYNGEGAAAVLRRRGASEAGAIFLLLDDLAGNITLLGPAPPTETLEPGVDRLFTRLHSPATIDRAEAEERLARQQSYDTDIWIVEIEDRLARRFFDESKS